jgi:hypothetical protein
MACYEASEHCIRQAAVKSVHGGNGQKRPGQFVRSGVIRWPPPMGSLLAVSC